MATDMAAKFEQGLFLTIVEQCEGCDRVVAHEAGKYCSSYANPTAKWRLGICNFATHTKPEMATVFFTIIENTRKQRLIVGNPFYQFFAADGAVQ